MEELGSQIEKRRVTEEVRSYIQESHGTLELNGMAWWFIGSRNASTQEWYAEDEQQFGGDKINPLDYDHSTFISGAIIIYIWASWLLERNLTIVPLLIP